jgi:hypothetical protein
MRIELHCGNFSVRSANRSGSERMKELWRQKICKTDDFILSCKKQKEPRPFSANVTGYFSPSQGSQLSVHWRVLLPNLPPLLECDYTHAVSSPLYDMVVHARRSHKLTAENWICPTM